MISQCYLVLLCFLPLDSLSFDELEERINWQPSEKKKSSP